MVAAPRWANEVHTLWLLMYKDFRLFQESPHAPSKDLTLQLYLGPTAICTSVGIFGISNALSATDSVLVLSIFLIQTHHLPQSFWTCWLHVPNKARLKKIWVLECWSHQNLLSCVFRLVFCHQSIIKHVYLNVLFGTKQIDHSKYRSLYVCNKRIFVPDSRLLYHIRLNSRQ